MIFIRKKQYEEGGTFRSQAKLKHPVFHRQAFHIQKKKKKALRTQDKDKTVIKN